MRPFSKEDHGREQSEARVLFDTSRLMEGKGIHLISYSPVRTTGRNSVVSSCRSPEIAVNLLQCYYLSHEVIIPGMRAYFYKLHL